MNWHELTNSDLEDLCKLYDEEPSHWHAMLRQEATKEMRKRHEKAATSTANLADRLRDTRGN